MKKVKFCIFNSFEHLRSAVARTPRRDHKMNLVGPEMIVGKNSNSLDSFGYTKYIYLPDFSLFVAFIFQNTVVLPLQASKKYSNEKLLHLKESQAK